MKIFKLLAVAFVAMLSFSSCDQHECEDFSDDHAADLVGTWTCLQKDFAEALVISADGSVTSTGVAFGEYWENVKGNIVVENGNVTMTFEDHDNYKGHFDIIPGVAFSIKNDEVGRFTYNYCKEDLSEEIVGMWVCTDGPANKEDDMLIQIFNEDGSSVMTGDADELLVNDESTTYKVIGDILFLQMNKDSVSYVPFRITYSPDGTTLGDVITLTLGFKNAGINSTASWLRIKEGLSTGKSYAYNTAYISNVKGAKDEEFSILGHTFNMANVKAGDFDMLFHSELFCVDLNENSIKQLFRANGQDIAIDIPVTVEGNKVTLHMGAENSILRDVDMYMFQDADASQLHIYMPTPSFINYFANLEVITLQVEGKIDSTEAAIEKVFADMEARIQSINVSFVMKAIK